MKIKITLAILFCITRITFGQQTSAYKEITNQLIVVDTIQVEKKFKNGTLKEKGTIINYVYGTRSLELYAGELTYYHNNGEIQVKKMLDEYGTTLTAKQYSRKGILLSETEVIKIDTKAKSPKEFLDHEKHLMVRKRYKYYDYSFKMNKWYLKKEGDLFNGVKSGIWKFYTADGKLKKEKNYL